MAKEYVVIEDDRCYVDTPVFTWRGDCCDFKRQLIMTKEIFQECYKKWILEEQKQTKSCYKMCDKWQKTGRWCILKDEYGDVVEAVCSNCDKNGNHKWAFCPNCGVKMQEVGG